MLVLIGDVSDENTKVKKKTGMRKASRDVLLHFHKRYYATTHSPSKQENNIKTVSTKLLTFPYKINLVQYRHCELTVGY